MSRQTVSRESSAQRARGGNHVAPQAGHWLLRERRFGHYVRSIQLSGAVDAKNITASLKDGVLELTVPKPKKVEHQTISIKAG